MRLSRSRARCHSRAAALRSIREQGFALCVLPFHTGQTSPRGEAIVDDMDIEGVLLIVERPVTRDGYCSQGAQPHPQKTLAFNGV